MDIPAALIEKYHPHERQPGDPRSERDEKLSDVFKRINALRANDGFPPVSYARLGKVFKGKTPAQIHTAIKECEAARSFSRFFTWKYLKKHL